MWLRNNIGRCAETDVLITVLGSIVNMMGGACMHDHLVSARVFIFDNEGDIFHANHKFMKQIMAMSMIFDLMITCLA